MMKQYFEMKEKYPNTILFFRLGDFYEMFFNDAKTVSRELESPSPAGSAAGRACPMCGVPFHSAESYIAKLVAKGYKVAICEQMEDPKLAKGLVKRDVIRVITPGTVLETVCWMKPATTSFARSAMRREGWAFASGISPPVT